MKRTFADKKAKLLVEMRERVLAVDPASKHEVEQAFETVRRLLLSAGRDPDVPFGSAPRGHDLCCLGFGDFIEKAVCDVYSTVGVESAGETLIIAQAYFRAIGAHGVFFRGQKRIDWELRSTLGRHYTKKTMAVSDPLTVASLELEHLRNFQERWKAGEVEADEIDVEQAEKLDRDSAAWWPLFQHYRGKHDLTRLLDITSSVLTALYFASEDCETAGGAMADGVLYLIPDDDNARRHRADAAELWDDLETDDLETYFNAPLHTENTTRLLVTQNENERLKSQRGAFLWWPEFHKPLPRQQFYLRVQAHAKERIREELRLLGVTEDSVMRLGSAISSR